jgi:hypothetical protein
VAQLKHPQQEITQTAVIIFKSTLNTVSFQTSFSSQGPGEQLLHIIWLARKSRHCEEVSPQIRIFFEFVWYIV